MTFQRGSFQLSSTLVIQLLSSTSIRYLSCRHPVHGDTKGRASEGVALPVSEVSLEIVEEREAQTKDDGDEIKEVR